MGMHEAFVALGANLGDARQTLAQALRAIDSADGLHVRAVSSFYRTAPVESSGPDYVNAVCRLEARCTAPDLLRQLLAIEADFGRVRPAGIINAPRTLDLDLLLFDDCVMDSPFLTLPHPRMHLRAFVLVPLVEIAPDVVIPGRGPARDFLASVAGQAIEPIAPADPANG